MEDKKHPLVSVPVITYNSAKTIVETLNSIYDQSYPRMELIVADDCSTDNTVEICQEWVAEHGKRFERVEVISSKQNTGVAANLNRGEDACRGEWVKPIAGDDLLLPTCLQDCMDYVEEHEDVVVLFSRCKAFGASKERCEYIDKVFDYTFFSLSQEEQLRRLTFEENCIPAAAHFYNRKRVMELGIRNDERIPMLEDWPKWINLLRAGVKFHFLDRETVGYRTGGISTGKPMNANQYKTSRLFFFYYQFPEWMKANKEKAIERVVEDECRMYLAYKESEKRVSQVLESKAYRVGKFLLKPVHAINEILNRKK